jgi:DNA polymerase
MNLNTLEKVAANCKLCALHKGRKNPVFAKGDTKAKFFICGMVPAQEENEAGMPFVGRAGKLLDNILEDVNLSLKDVYITNLVKCFLAAGEPLEQEWIDSCLPYLIAQVNMIEPIVIVALGKDASNALTLPDEDFPMYKLRKNVYNYGCVKVVPTYHPSYILRKGGKNSEDYQKVISDFEKAKNILEKGLTN